MFTFAPSSSSEPAVGTHVTWWRGGTVLLLVVTFAPLRADADTTGLRLLFVDNAAPFSSLGAGGKAKRIRGRAMRTYCGERAARRDAFLAGVHDRRRAWPA